MLCLPLKHQLRLRTRIIEIEHTPQKSNNISHNNHNSRACRVGSISGGISPFLVIFLQLFSLACDETINCPLTNAIKPTEKKNQRKNVPESFVCIYLFFSIFFLCFCSNTLVLQSIKKKKDTKTNFSCCLCCSHYTRMLINTLFRFRM